MTTASSPLTRLLRHNLSAPHLAGYAAASLLGLMIIFSALQFYADSTHSPVATADYLVISPRVEGLSATSAGFTPAEIDSLAAAPWVRRVGPVTQSRFQVMASAAGSAAFSTQLFLESVPDGFLDVDASEWTGYDPATADFVPLVLSRDFLTLYNYGFAVARSLPRLSEQLAATLPLSLTLAGNGHSLTLQAYVVGFSSRLNTVAVPEAFMQWANARFAPQPHAATALPSRLIIEVTNPGDPAITACLEAHGWQTDGDKDAARHASRMLMALTSVVAAIGAVISVLAIAILLLSLSLLLSRSAESLHRLMALGYRPSYLASRYGRVCLALNCAVAAAAFLLTIAARPLWADATGAGGFPWTAAISAATAALLLSAIDSFYLRKRTLRYFRHDS